MSIFEDTNPRELKELLGQIYSRDMALPDFQRDFVWDPNATQELIVSIANNFPAGSLLRIRNTHDLFACREVQNAPVLDGYKPTFLVLDGQQRLTSLYQAFFGVGDHRYFLDLKKLLDGADFEEAVFHMRANTKRAKRLEDFAVQAQELILPLRVLKGGAGGSSHWTLQVAKTLGNGGGLERIEELGNIQERWVQAIDDYRFPVVTLSDQTGADAVCTIFETLNRTGVKLSVFELLTARFWPKNVSLRDLWTRTRELHPLIADFDIDPYYLLQAIALASRRTPSCKRSDVLNLSVADIEEWWQACTDGLGHCLKILKEDCGVILAKWLPYNTIIIPLAAVLAMRPLPGTPDAGASRQKLVRWYWCSVFGQAYENAPNSQAAKDVLDLAAWLDGGDPPETVTALRFDPRSLRDTTYRQRALYRGVMCLVLSGAPRDFYTGEPLTQDLMIENLVDDHHVFPDHYLKHLDVPPSQRQRDCVLNRTLIDRKTNNRIRANPPAKYMQEIRSALGGQEFDELLDSHQLPAGADSPFWSNDFHEYLRWREAAIWQQIKQVTGVTDASDLLEEDEAAA